MADQPELFDESFRLSSPTVVLGRGDEKDDGRDFYPTPRWCTALLLKHWWQPVKGETVLDPSCGEGAILDLYRERGCRTVGLELDAQRAAVARERGHQVEQVDALREPWPDAFLLVGNPPYSLAQPFVQKAAAWARKKRGRHAAMLMRLSFLEPADGRGDLFRAFPPDVLILPRRPSFDGKGSDNVTSAWLCWPQTEGVRWLPP